MLESGVSNRTSLWWRDFKKVCGEENSLKWFDSCISWDIKGGRNFSFWKYGWLDGVSIANKFGMLFLVSNLQDKMIGDMGRWVDGVWLWEFMWQETTILGRKVTY